MKQQKAIMVLVMIIALFSVIATSEGIFSDSGPGPYNYQSIRGKSVPIYGKGLYRHMSSDVAIQGIAQDYVTLFLGIPLLLGGLFWAAKGSLKGRFFLAGLLDYFLVTYLFYMGIAMFNQLFLVYVVLTGTSFFAFSLVLLSFETDKLPQHFQKSTPIKFPGIFLIFTSLSIGLLWLGVVVPPLLDGSIYPEALQHYTTLTVQSLDLSIFLPITFIAGWLLIKKRKLGYLMALITLIFLTMLMIALLAKLIAMALNGVNIVPAIFLIPVFAIISGICSYLLLRGVKNQPGD